MYIVLSVENQLNADKQCLLLDFTILHKNEHTFVSLLRLSVIIKITVLARNSKVIVLKLYISNAKTVSEN